MPLTSSKNWKTVRLGDLVSKVIDNRGKTPPILNEGFELLEVNAVTEKSRFPNYEMVKKFIGQETYDTWFRAGHIKKGDVIIPTVGTIGNVAISLENRGSIAQNLVALRFKEQNDSMFLYYLLSTPSFKKQIFNLDIGGVQPSIKVPHLLNSEILIPESLPEQHEIAAILGSLDDKIELLRKENKTLESIAQTLFKEWFVDFRFPGATKKMIELDQLIEFEPKEKVSKNQEYLFFDMKTLSNDSMGILDGVYKKVSSGSIFRINDTLLAKITPCLENGKTGFIFDIKNESLARGSTEFIVMRAKNYTSPYFVYCLARSGNFRDHAIKSMSGTSGRQRVQVFQLKKYYIGADKKQMEDFHESVDPLFEKVKNNNFEIQSLSKLRDEILPLLISGKLSPFDSSGHFWDNKGAVSRKVSKDNFENTAGSVQNCHDTTTVTELNTEQHHRSLSLNKEDGTLKSGVVETGSTIKATPCFRENGKEIDTCHNCAECFFIFTKKELEEAGREICSGKRKFKKVRGEFEDLEFLLDPNDKERNSLYEFCEVKDHNISELYNDLISHNYKISPYVGVVISRGKGKKPRTLLVPKPRDRVIFTATFKKILGDLDFINNFNVFGSHKHTKFKKMKEILDAVARESSVYKYVLKIDIKDFFPSINREILLDKIKVYIKDKRIFNLINSAIYNKIQYPLQYKENGVLKSCVDIFQPLENNGIPQGCAFSPLLANIYALDIDKYFSDNKYTSFRYLDDLIVFTNTKEEAEELFCKVKEIAKGICLEVHEFGNDKKSYIKEVTEPLLYLGVKIVNKDFFIPEEAIKEFLGITETTGVLSGVRRICNKHTIKINHEKVVNKGLIPYIRGWKEFYSKVCENDFKKKKDMINFKLKEYYKKTFKDDLVHYRNNESIYL